AGPADLNCPLRVLLEVSRAQRKRWGRYARSAGAPHVEHRGNGLQENPEILPECPFPDIVDLQPDDLLKVRNEVSAVDLPGTGNSRLYIEPGVVMLLVKIDLGGQRRAGADQRHVTTQDIPQLGQLIQTGSSQERSQPRDPWVVLDFEQPEVIVEAASGQVLPQGLRVMHHAPKLGDLEQSATEPYPRLPEEDRARG